jgi:hypothetical protein
MRIAESPSISDRGRHLTNSCGERGSPRARGRKRRVFALPPRRPATHGPTPADQSASPPVVLRRADFKRRAGFIVICDPPYLADMELKRPNAPRPSNRELVGAYGVFSTVVFGTVRRALGPPLPGPRRGAVGARSALDLAGPTATNARRPPACDTATRGLGALLRTPDEPRRPRRSPMARRVRPCWYTGCLHRRWNRRTGAPPRHGRCRAGAVAPSPTGPPTATAPEAACVSSSATRPRRIPPPSDHGWTCNNGSRGGRLARHTAGRDQRVQAVGHWFRAFDPYAPGYGCRGVRAHGSAVTRGRVTSI